VSDDRQLHLNIVEALIFASPEPTSERAMRSRLPEGVDLAALLKELAGRYAERGIRLAKVGENWAFRTAAEVAPHLQLERKSTRKLSRAAVETLGIIAYHQPVTRAEIEEIRGVGLSQGSLDVLLECNWIKPGKRRRTPGRPLTWVTTQEFLDHFALESLDNLPGLDELKASGLLAPRATVHAFHAAEAAEGGEEAVEEATPLELDEAAIVAEDDDEGPERETTPGGAATADEASEVSVPNRLVAIKNDSQ
jgi:segregation and condensation protein B